MCYIFSEILEPVARLPCSHRFVAVVVVLNICQSIQPFYKVSITILVGCLNTLISANVVN